MSSVIDTEILEEIVMESREQLSQAACTIAELNEGSDIQVHVHALFRWFHTVKGLSAMASLDDITKLAHKIETTLDGLRSDESASVNRQQLDFLLEMTDLVLSLFDEADQMQAQPTLPAAAWARVTMFEAAFGRVDHAEPVAAASSEPSEGANSTASKAAQPKECNNRETVRVGLDDLDEMMSQIGELILSSRRLQHLRASQDGAVSWEYERTLSDISENLHNAINQLYEQVVEVRCVPFSGMLDRLRRLLRDAARRLDKQVDLQVIGADLQIDRSVMATLQDPLTHMLRNSVGHGVELPADRVAAGKSEVGRVQLEVSQTDELVVVAVSDDGKGLDPEVLRRLAVSKGLRTDAAAREMSDDELFLLIFEPGFSTATVIDDVSGRGVGMDVVISKMREAGGRVVIESVLGQGATFILEVPKPTLPVHEGLVVDVGSHTFLLPLRDVVSVARIEAEQLVYLANGTVMAKLGEDVLRLVLQQAVSEWIMGVVIDTGAGPWMLGVDRVVGQQRVLVCGIDEWVPAPSYLMDAFVLGDGRAGFVLSLEKLGHEGWVGGIS